MHMTYRRRLAYGASALILAAIVYWVVVNATRPNSSDPAKVQSATPQRAAAKPSGDVRISEEWELSPTHERAAMTVVEKASGTRNRY